MNEVTTRAFKSGNSVALRLPKALGIRAGTEMRIREEGGRYIFEPIEPRKTINLTGIAGSCPDLQPFTPEEREFEDIPRRWDLLEDIPA